MATKYDSDLNLQGVTRILNLPDAVLQQEPATLAQLQNRVTVLENALTLLLNAKAPLASPAITGSPTINGVAPVITTDSRLSDARTPAAHNQEWSTITSKPITLTDYGISISDPLLAGSSTPTLDALTNVTTTSKVTGDLLKWNSTTNKWVNSTLVGAGIAPLASPAFTGNATIGTVSNAANFALSLAGGVDLMVGTGSDTPSSAKALWVTKDGGTTANGFSFQLNSTGGLSIFVGDGSATWSKCLSVDKSGNVTATTFKGALSGNATTATSVSGTVGIGNGGTGATSASEALTALGGVSASTLTSYLLKSSVLGSLSTNGYFKIPTTGGTVIVQWGQATTAGEQGPAAGTYYASATIYFPVAFASTNYTVVPINTSSIAVFPTAVGSQGTSNCMAYVGAVASGQVASKVVRWIAIGY